MGDSTVRDLNPTIFCETDYLENALRALANCPARKVKASTRDDARGGKLSDNQRADEERKEEEEKI